MEEELKIFMLRFGVKESTVERLVVEEVSFPRQKSWFTFYCSRAMDKSRIFNLNQHFVKQSEQGRTFKHCVFKNCMPPKSGQDSSEPAFKTVKISKTF